MTTTAAFLGGARYSRPLDATSEKKWRLMSGLGEIFVIGFSQDLRLRRFAQHAHFYLLPKFPWPVLRYLSMFTVGPALALWLILRHGVRVLVAQSPYEGFAAAIAKRIARLFGHRTVLIVENHGDFEISLFLQRKVRWSSLYRWLMRITARFALRHADLLRAVSGSTRRQLEAWAPGKPLVQFPAWTDIEVFLEAGSRECPREPVVLYAGVLIPRKGVHHLVRAFAKVAPGFPKARLEIVGREENRDYAEELRREVHRLGLDGRVCFVGEVHQVELAERMRRAWVFVLPSLSEGLGRVVVEAMATGTPVVGSRVGGIPEMVQDGLTGFLVPPGDEEALAERLRWVLEHPQEAEAMGRRAQEFARSFFSSEAYVQNYMQMFKQAMEKAFPDIWIWDSLARVNPIHAAVSAIDEEGERKKTKHIIDLLMKELDGSEIILDLGCGYGRIAKYLLPRRKFTGYIGMDRSLEMLRIFLNRYTDRPQEKRTLLLLAVSYIDRIPLCDCSVDAVIVSAVFLHNHKSVTKASIDEIWRVLKPGGRLLVFGSFPNLYTLTGIQGVVYLLYLKMIGHEFKQGPVRYFSKHEVKDLLRKFKVVKINHVGFSVIPKSILLFPKPLSYLWRTIVFRPVQHLLGKITPAKMKQLLCGHYDVIAYK